MSKEIERKFLVIEDSWRTNEGIPYRQGYLSTDRHRTVRVRIAGSDAWLTVKGITRGATRAEYEYPIPVDDAREMLDTLCHQPLVEKTRYRVDFGGLTWEVDEFEGANAGLVVAEVELEREDQPFERPPWLGQEVTHDPKYFNANLVEKPYTRW
ncbi:MAG: CYTH domain-containing protein [Gammaproteobacteria bacterium]|nr:CYTH domain-containing protein [Gammaproteobacteria bacterium]